MCVVWYGVSKMQNDNTIYILYVQTPRKRAIQPLGNTNARDWNTVRWMLCMSHTQIHAHRYTRILSMVMRICLIFGNVCVRECECECVSVMIVMTMNGWKIEFKFSVSVFHFPVSIFNICCCWFFRSFSRHFLVHINMKHCVFYVLEWVDLYK